MDLKKKDAGYTFEELQSFMNGCNKVYLYGMGKVALQLATMLTDKGLDWFAFVTTTPNPIGTNFFAHPAYSIEDISFEEDEGIVLAVAERTQDEILSILKRKNVLAKIYPQRVIGRTIDVPSNYLKGADINQGFFGRFHELDNWGALFDTDKHHGKHDYLRKYELFLQYYKDKEFTLLELGIYHGGSLATWGGIKSASGYFRKAKVVGVDIDSGCYQYAREQDVIIKDLGVAENLEELKSVHPSIIVDDASHFCSHQIMAFLILWDVLPSGGIYIMEDIETSFPHIGFIGYDDAIISAYDVCQGIAECVTSGGKLRNKIPLQKYIEEIATQIDMISFIQGSCIMIKK